MSTPDTSQSARVVITGAAGALGRSVLRRFARDGARVIAVDRDAKHLEAALPELAAVPAYEAVAVDITDKEAVARALGPVIAHFGGVDALVHVAGGFEMGEAVHEISRESWLRMMDLNAWSLVAVSAAVVPSMQAQGGGRIVAVSARSAAHGLARMGSYIASKSALQRLVESLSHELRDSGICVNSVAPSILDTPANRAGMPGADTSAWVSTEDAAAVIAFLASPAAATVHGQHVELGR